MIQRMRNLQIGTIYEGQFKRGEKTGYARQIQMDGQFYEGYFINGVPHGQGKLTTPKGETYEGKWIQGKLFGDRTIEPGQYDDSESEYYDEEEEGG